MLRDRVPPSTTSLLIAKVAAMAGNPAAARSIGWEALVRDVERLGLDPRALGQVALGSAQTFDAGSGAFLVASVSTGDGRLPSLDPGSPVAFRLDGIEFRPSTREGWFWAGAPGVWVAACDRVGCGHLAPVLSGRAPSLFAAPPEDAVRRILAAVSDDAPATIVWIPAASTRDAVEAGSAWTGFAASAYFRNAVPSQLMQKIGVVRGMTGDVRDESGRARLSARIAMSSAESARFVAGSLKLMQGLASGVQSLAESFGMKPPPGPPPPQVAVESEDNVVRLSVLASQ